MLATNLTISAAAGSASTPSIAFTGAGIYSPGADQLAVSTGGTGRLFIDSSGRVGIGTSSAAALFHVTGAALIRGGNQSSSNNAPLPSETSPLSVLAYTGYLASPSTSINIGAANFDAVNNNNPFRYSITTPGGGGLNSFAVNSVEYNGSTYVTKERLRIDSSGRVGIGTSSPESQLNVGVGSARLRASQAGITTAISIVGGDYNQQNNAALILSGGQANDNRVNSWVIQSLATGTDNLGVNDLRFCTGSYSGTAYGISEKLRIDSSGRLLVGTSTARSNLYNANYSPVVQIETTGTLTQRTLNLAYNANGGGAGGPILSLISSNGGAGSNTIVTANQELGGINFLGTDGTNPISGVAITAYVDGTPALTTCQEGLSFLPLPMDQQLRRSG